jgi:tRNA-splicing ligase RtcB
MKEVIYQIENAAGVHNVLNVPIKSWVSDIEDTALEQAINLANLPFAAHHIALMPGCHMGYGMPVESVLAARGVIIPNAVGVDIGCGMTAVRLPLKEIPSVRELKDIIHCIRTDIPVGPNKHKGPKPMSDMPEHSESYTGEARPIVIREMNNARKSMGTLGGGNHFIEIQYDDRHCDMWVMLHSGSRNLGKQVADHYNKVAQEINGRYYSSVVQKKGLAFFPLGFTEAQDYLREMEYCIEFARLSRKMMMERVIEAFYMVVGMEGKDHHEMIDCCHNYARMENHFGKNVMVHRKGATSAKKGEMGIIPGSQGTPSYIIKGRGNAESFESCSHGAGRCMGRKQAKKELNLEEEQNRLDMMGIIHSVRAIKDLDEAPGAYKNIEAVMRDQEDLVEVVAKLRPLAVVKG